MVLAVIVLSLPLAFGQYVRTHHTTLILDYIPSTIEQGHKLTFSGKLFTSDDKTPLPNKTVYIQYDSPYDWTSTIASATTDKNGNFEVVWIAKPKFSSACTYNIFAHFNSDDDNYWSISNQYQLHLTTSSFKN